VIEREVYKNMEHSPYKQTSNALDRFSFSSFRDSRDPQWRNMVYKGLHERASS
jgi:hypothetical protein